MIDEMKVRETLDELVDCADREPYRQKLIEIIHDELECVCTNVDLVRSGYAEYDTYPHDVERLGNRLTEIGNNEDYNESFLARYNDIMARLDQILITIPTDDLYTAVVLSVI